MAAPVAESYARGVPLMLEGELGAGQVEIAMRLYLDGPFADQPFVAVALDELTERGWRHVLKSAESPLFQTGLTLCIEGWNAVGPQRLRELVSTMADTALATRCHVVLTANDMPGGSESDQAAFVTERFACAVSVAPAIVEQGATSQEDCALFGISRWCIWDGSAHAVCRGDEGARCLPLAAQLSAAPRGLGTTVYIGGGGRGGPRCGGGSASPRGRD